MVSKRKAAAHEPPPLRPHQERAIAGLRQSLLSGRKRPMLQMPTGAGKTLTAAWIIRGLIDRGKRVAFVVPRTVLVDQTIREFEGEGISAIGVMQAAHLRTDSRQPVQICSAQTLARRERPDVDFVIVDEAHEMHASVLEWIKDCPAILFIGLSATPWARGLGKYYDDLLIPTTTRELIDATPPRLSDFVAFAPSEPDLSGVSTKRGEYDEDELADAMDTTVITADIVAEWLKRGRNLPTICFCVNRRHGKNVLERFRVAGIAAEYIDGNTPQGNNFDDPDPRGETRRDMFARFESGETKILVSIGVLTTGFDADVRCIIDAQPTKSRIRFVQKIGRGLRTADGKDKLVILDHAGNHLRLGRVTDIHQAHLDDGKKRKASDRKEEKRESPPKLCKECKAVLSYRAIECSACGAKIIAVTEVQEVDGELVAFGSMKSGKKPPATMEEKAQFYADALAFMRGKPHALKRANATFRDRFGVWPNSLGWVKPAAKCSFVTESWIRGKQQQWFIAQKASARKLKRA
jgi:DNA repair protein RadD